MIGHLTAFDGLEMMSLHSDAKDAEQFEHTDKRVTR
jgi:hypothetical protein